MVSDKALSKRLTRIGDADDPRIDGFRDIRERDLRRRAGRFVAEGTVVLRVLADVHGGPGGFAAESVLVLENRVAGIADILACFPDDVPVNVAPRPVLDEIAGFPVHRGVLALGRRGETGGLPALLADLPPSALVVLGQAISNHDNMGGIFRNAAVFGADAAIFDDRSCDPLYRKSIRVSVGGVLRVPFARGGDIEAGLDALAEGGFELIGLSPRGATTIDDIAPTARVALVLGTEGEGLPGNVLARLRTVRIPQAPGMDSLNVATASGIALHRLAARMGRLL